MQLIILLSSPKKIMELNFLKKYLKQLFFPIKVAMGQYVAIQKLFHEGK
jgi:hypothetical protein